MTAEIIQQDLFQRAIVTVTTLEKSIEKATILRERYKHLGFDALSSQQFDIILNYNMVIKSKLEYPLEKIICHLDAKDICKKYNLQFSKAEYLIESIPETNLNDIEQHIKRYPLDKRKNGDNGFIIRDPFFVIADKTMLIQQANKTDANNAISSFDQDSDDPIVLRQVNNHCYIVVTAWGTEKEAVFNELLN